MSNPHAILSDIHRLLSSYDREEFLRASKYPGLGTAIKGALLALASEAPTGGLASRDAVDKKPSEKRLTQSDQKPASQDERLPLAASILKSESGETIGSLRAFATNQGLKLQYRPKESKDRLARRIAGALIDLPETKRNQALASLLGKVSTQTQGWIDVIKGSKS